MTTMPALPLPGDGAPARLEVRGEAALLRRPLLALFCSRVVPPTVVLGMLDVARALRDHGVGVVSGFHAPLERESLAFLLDGRGPVVVCKAREVRTLRLPAAWRAPLEGGRLLLVSTTGGTVRRPTRALAAQRNHVAASLASAVFVAHARPGGALFPLAREALAAGRPLYCLPDDANADLCLLGARALEPAALVAALRADGITAADPLAGL